MHIWGLSTVQQYPNNVCSSHQLVSLSDVPQCSKSMNLTIYGHLPICEVTRGPELTPWMPPNPEWTEQVIDI